MTRYRDIVSKPIVDAIDPAVVKVAIVGAGMSGAACAAGLLGAGVEVTVFDKSRHVGGRMSNRCASWTDASGGEHPVSFDPGAQSFTAMRPRFRAAMARAVASGRAAEWQPIVHASQSGRSGRRFVGTPSMPTLCSHLLGPASLFMKRTVRRLQRTADGAWYVAIEGAPLAGPFDHVVLALPPAQAAVLLAGHEDAWASMLMARRMEPCWTLMAVTGDVDWPWDAAEPDRGPLAWVARNDRMPGRNADIGRAVWTAHATAEWSAAHLEADPQIVRDALRTALQAQLPSTNGAAESLRWHHAEVHRWRYSGPVLDGEDDGRVGETLWDEALGLGVCGDWLGGGGGVEAAWQSGDELADTMAAAFERLETAPEPALALV